MYWIPETNIIFQVRRTKGTHGTESEKTCTWGFSYGWHGAHVKMPHVYRVDDVDDVDSVNGSATCSPETVH